jgi:hypothetical protein
MSVAIRGTVFVLSFTYYVLIVSELVNQYMRPLQRMHSYFGLYLVLGSLMSRFQSKIPIVPTSSKLILELVAIILLNKLMAHAVLLLIRCNIVVLFRATNFTAALAMGVAGLAPLALLALVPLLKKVSWYYLVAYCALCGGIVLASVFGLSVALGLVWKHTVISPWTDSEFFSLSPRRSRTM